MNSMVLEGGHPTSPNNNISYIASKTIFDSFNSHPMHIPPSRQAFGKMFMCTIAALFFTATMVVSAQNYKWPQEITSDNGAVITIYQPQPEKLNGNILQSRAAVSVLAQGAKDPVFGAIWATSVLETDRDERMALLVSVKVTDVRFPGSPDTVTVNKFKALIEREVPKWKLLIEWEALTASLEEEMAQGNDAKLLKNDPPKIIFEKAPSVLVSIDGEPKLNDAGDTGVKRIVNTPFIILNDPKAKKYFLNGNGLWYESASLKNDWKVTTSLTAPVKKISDDLLKAGAIANPDSVQNEVIPKIIVVTEPSELIQSKGEPKMMPIKGTNLLYVQNTEDNIFMDISSQYYFALLSGRWYKSKALANGTWEFVASDKLPADFAKIPVGSEKDIVLANVAGTPQAKDALLDAQVPQTATVDRKTATTTVEYDGEPQFAKVDGTEGLFYAVNTSSTVLQYEGAYYCVDNGVWFLSKDPKGPWMVSTERPEAVKDIKPESPVYNVKYVYIYDYTPEVVYVGYTPGYMGCYAYGSTVVYGTGYYYQPWYGAYYYPRPVTYGYGMTYNPWTGWSFGMSMSFGGPYGWMSFGYHPYPPYWGPYHGGCWGPPYHYPPYHHHSNHYYGNRPVQVNHHGNNNYYSRRNSNASNNNIYKNKPGISTNDMRRPTSGTSNVGNRQATNKAGNNAANMGASKPNNVYTDKSGNVYRNNSRNQVEQRNNNQWQSAGGAQNKATARPGTSATNKSYSPSNNTTSRNNYNQYRQQTRPSGSSMSRPSGGGGMSRGGGGGRR
jgi:hypothetical protein